MMQVVNQSWCNDFEVDGSIFSIQYWSPSMHPSMVCGAAVAYPR
jgi:hypothetical protein